MKRVLKGFSNGLRVLEDLGSSFPCASFILFQKICLPSLCLSFHVFLFPFLSLSLPSSH